MFAVLKREFRSYFQNVIGWLFVAALMALFGLYFYVYNLRQGYPYLYYTLSAITIIFMIAVPILTMRSFAEDRKNKTDQLMLTAPVPVAKVVLGKYLAMLAVFTVDIAVFCVTPLILRAFGTIPMGESYIAILAFWLYGAASIAVVEGKYLRRERYTGSCQRSFYVGEYLRQEDIRASFQNGILTLFVPKEDKTKTEEKKYITIA